jgi:hypothetical protein
MGMSDLVAFGTMGAAALCGVGCLASLLLALPISMVAVGKYNIYFSNKQGDLSWSLLQRRKRIVIYYVEKFVRKSQ